MTEWKRKDRAGDDDGDFGPAFDRALISEATPYVHWWASKEVEATSLEGEGKVEAFNGSPRSLANFFLEESATLASTDTEKGEVSSGNSVSPHFGARPASEGKAARILALPQYAINENVDTSKWVPPDGVVAKMGKLEKDTVIVGIIDDGIALGNARFRLPSADGTRPGDTRFLWSWMQGAKVQPDSSQPFGSEVFAIDINRALAQYDKDGLFDEDGFNQEMDPSPFSGHRSVGAAGLMGAVGHGTHVLDLACGADPVDGSKVELEKTRIMSVTLPSRSSIGMAGTFLEFYVVYAMRHIVKMVDKLWEETFGGEPGGFPVVINLSYGQQAGPKTGTSLIEQEFLNLRAERQQGKVDAELRLVMPVGNDNLAQCSARWELKSNSKSFPLNWRILPQDQSSNFLEIWTNFEPDEDVTMPFPLEIMITPSGEQPGEWIEGADNAYFEHPDGHAMVYSEVFDVPDMTGEGIEHLGATGITRRFEDAKRLRYVVAARPTLDHHRPDKEAPAGSWSIVVRWARHIREQEEVTSREVYLYVQVDQDPTAVSQINHRAYLENDRYRKYAPSGRALDTVSYLRSEAGLAGQGTNLEPANVFGAIHRRGTQNSLAVDDRIILIAGHRASDGRPADFSAAVLPKDRRPKPHQGVERTNSTASFPVDISPAQTGIRAAGTATGSTASLRGTSFAAPQATRWVVSEMRAALIKGETDLSTVGTGKSLKEVAEKAEIEGEKNQRYWGGVKNNKLGGGRMELNR